MKQGNITYNLYEFTDCGIEGGNDPGKTTVVLNMQKQFSFGELSVFSRDSFYLDNQHLKLEGKMKKNFNHPVFIQFQLMIERNESDTCSNINESYEPNI